MHSDENRADTCANSPVVYTVEARCLGVIQSSRRRQEIYDVANSFVGESAVMPAIYIQDKIAQMREAPSSSLSERLERLKKAGQFYEQATLAGLEPKAYAKLVTKVTGLQPSVIEQSLANISHGLRHMSEILQAATPAGAVWEYSHPLVNSGCSLFSRRGEVVSIIAAGNGPGAHGLWPQAVAMGYRTLVRPSTREPFTAQRLICALEQAGLADYVALIPTDHKGVETLISQSDLAVVYGGPDVAARYGSNPRVLVQGPGQSKVVVGNDVCHEEAVEVVAQSVLSLGGAACVSASAVLVEENPGGFARKLRQVFEAHSQVQPMALAKKQEAEIYENLLRSDDAPWNYDRTLISEGCPLKPHVALVESASDSKVQRELPFPCVTIAPFNQLGEEGYKALSGSLVVTLLTHQKSIINKVLGDSSIANVYIGHIPTTWMDYRVPHDGYLADFLMCNRGIRIDPLW
ncbi:aldehyde dehydrogenase family protein [Endozoicomonas sp. SM1973]|uniref:Aldehyde dehydrogenase family protein n=1 Tax=Spartinivicinus marinus TaxID=2994442 RepID=A0A853I4V9_9GAMM|nr:aldehyde dehydrogenase family protein [Spartinivicinus marinus]MCX4028194.1 aldehyde dehydrogenase family protein [Spartinivicinus marinus]NYZ68393.1 aldehyde dehydrogenase family protein [Spartinivicinus marinus]